MRLLVSGIAVAGGYRASLLLLVVGWSVEDVVDPTSVFSSEERRVSSTMAFVGAVAGVVVAIDDALL